MENMCFKKAEFFLDLEYWLSDQIYTQAAEKQPKSSRKAAEKQPKSKASYFSY